MVSKHLLKESFFFQVQGLEAKLKEVEADLKKEKESHEKEKEGFVSPGKGQGQWIMVYILMIYEPQIQIRLLSYNFDKNDHQPTTTHNFIRFYSAV